jgi:hypothetical protein
MNLNRKERIESGYSSTHVKDFAAKKWEVASGHFIHFKTPDSGDLCDVQCSVEIQCEFIASIEHV